MDSGEQDHFKLPDKAFYKAPRTKTGIVDLKPDWINVDAKNFQYKAGGDQFGVTERLQGVHRFDHNLCGLLLVWEDGKGRLFIADGHQRMGLAMRAQANGQKVEADKIWLPCRIYKESDGFSREDVKIIAAFKNIAEGTGTAVDAARLIRTHGKLPETIPPRSTLVRQAKALATLSDSTFALVYNEVISPEYGAVIGDVLSRMNVEPEKRDGMEQAIVKAFLDPSLRPSNEMGARFLATEVVKTGMTDASQSLLFDFSESDNILKERIEILESALRSLNENLGIKRFMSTYESKISPYYRGGLLDKKAVNAERDDLLVMRLILKTGWQYAEVGTMLNGAARDFNRQKKRLEKDPHLAKLILASLDATLNDCAREIKQARVKGETDEKITKLRVSAVRKFLGGIKEYAQTSDVARALRRSLGSQPEIEPEDFIIPAAEPEGQQGLL